MIKKCFITCLSFLFIASQQVSKIEFPLIINAENVFNFNGKYPVLFYLDSCLSCRNTKLRIQVNINKFECFYYVNLAENKSLKTNIEESNINKNDYKTLKIFVVPTLLLIDDGIVKNEFHGSDDIWMFIKNASR